MKAQALSDLLDQFALLDGLIGCAVLDAETGMAWKTSGNAKSVQFVCEAATDYWRLHQRQEGEFASLLGPLVMQMIFHSRGRITIAQCSKSLLFVCLTREPDKVDWRLWKQKFASLKNLAI